MKIEEFRTVKFRNIIKQIAESNGADFKAKKLKFFLGGDGETKSVNINGNRVEDVIAVYFTKEEVINGTRICPHPITFNDYLSFNRDLTISSVLGEEVKVKDFRKKSEKIEPFNLEVGNLYLMSSGIRNDETSVIKIVKRTKTTADYVYVKYELPKELEDKKTLCFPYVTEYSIRCDFNDLKLYDETFGGGKLRASTGGYWKNGWSRVYGYNKEFRESYYLD